MFKVRVNRIERWPTLQQSSKSTSMMEEEPNPYRAEKKIQTKSGEGV
jgi:hypothetical protein